MGFLDDVVGKVKEAVGGGEHSALASEVLGLLSAGSEGGGLQGVIQSFKDKGLGDIMSSWIGTGQNLPISGDQLKTGLGTRADAERFGHPRRQLTCAGNKVGVEMCVQAIRQSEAHPFGDLEITIHIPLRVDDGGLPGFSGTDQIG